MSENENEARSQHKIVLRFASVHPSHLSRIRMHGQRSGGPLDHVEAEFSKRNRVYVGENFVDEILDELEHMRRHNLAEELAALERLKRAKKMREREVRGLQDPWHTNCTKPLREVILTTHRDYFLADSLEPDDRILVTKGERVDGTVLVHRLSIAKVEAFAEAGREFFERNFPGVLRHLRLDLDEETPHFHAVLMPTTEKTTASRGTQKLVQPSAHPLLANYERAQDAAGIHFARIGLSRGEKRAEARRAAKQADMPAPEQIRHQSPREYRAKRAQRRLELDEEAERRAQEASARLAAAEAAHADAERARAEAEIVVNDARDTASTIVQQARDAAGSILRAAEQKAQDFLSTLEEGFDALLASNARKLVMP